MLGSWELLGSFNTINPHSLDMLGRPQARSLGEFHFKGLEEPLSLVEVLPPQLADRRFEALRMQRVQRGSVPAETGELIGRKEELALLHRRLAEGARLVTLLGPGGMGKSRLATRFGHQELGSWEGGVWLCELADGMLEGGLHVCDSKARHGPPQLPAPARRAPRRRHPQRRQSP